MRKVFIILSALSILVGCSRDQKEEPAVKEKDGWELVWEDDFNRDLLLSPRSCFCGDDMPINNLGRSTIDNN